MITRKRNLVLIAVLLTLLLLSPVLASSATGSRGAQTVVDVEFLGEVVVPTGMLFEGTEIGGLSSITFDSGRDVYYVLSDDQGNRPTGDPVRYYTVAIDLDDGALDAGDVTFVDVTQLFERRKTPFAPGGVDPEGLVLSRGGSLFMSSEGNIFADPIIDPFIRRYNLNGRVTARLPIPDKYVPNGVDHGVRFNLAFESLNLTPDRRSLVTAGEGALFQDGPASTFTNTSFARILIYDLPRRQPTAEYVYEVGPWAEPSAIFGVNGIVEVLPIDDVGTMLVMERSFSVGGVLGGGTGNVVVSLVWSPFWNHFTVEWVHEELSRVLHNADEVYDAIKRGELIKYNGVPDSHPNGFVVNCPIPILANNTYKKSSHTSL